MIINCCVIEYFMENINFFILIFLSILAVANLVFLIILFSRSRAYANDNAQAMVLVMNYLTKSFDNNAQQHQEMQVWMEKTLSKMYESSNYQQAYLSRLGDFLGYRPRNNIDT